MGGEGGGAERKEGSVVVLEVIGGIEDALGAEDISTFVVFFFV